MTYKCIQRTRSSLFYEQIYDIWNIFCDTCRKVKACRSKDFLDVYVLILWEIYIGIPVAFLIHITLGFESVLYITSGRSYVCAVSLEFREFIGTGAEFSLKFFETTFELGRIIFHMLITCCICFEKC